MLEKHIYICTLYTDHMICFEYDVLFTIVQRPLRECLIYSKVCVLYFKFLSKLSIVSGPGKVLDLHVTPYDYERAYVTWQLPDLKDHNGILQNYRYLTNKTRVIFK